MCLGKQFAFASASFQTLMVLEQQKALILVVTWWLKCSKNVFYVDIFHYGQLFNCQKFHQKFYILILMEKKWAKYHRNLNVLLRFHENIYCKSLSLHLSDMSVFALLVLGTIMLLNFSFLLLVYFICVLWTISLFPFSFVFLTASHFRT